MFPNLKARRDDEGYDFGDQVVQVRTRRDLSRDEGGYYYQKVQMRRVGESWFLTGEPADNPPHENPYRGVTFWLAVGEIVQMRVYASMAAAHECSRAFQRLYPTPPAGDR